MENVSTSTPIWDFRQKEDLDNSASPSEREPVLNFSNGSFTTSFECGDSLNNEALGGLDISFGLSSGLRSLLLQPRTDDEHTELRKVLRETINLTRAAILSGLLSGQANAEEFVDTLAENCLFRPFGCVGSDTVADMFKNLDLSDWEWEDELIDVERYKYGKKEGGVITETLTYNNTCDKEVLYHIKHDSVRNCYVADYGGLDFKFGAFVGEEILKLEPGEDSKIKCVEKGGFSYKESTRGGLLSTQVKRKNSPSTSPVLHSEQVLRLKTNDGGSSPVLRPRTSQTKLFPGSKLPSPPRGKTKINRRLGKPRRLMNDKMKQALLSTPSPFSPKTERMKQVLITASFSPKEGVKKKDLQE